MMQPPPMASILPQSKSKGYIIAIIIFIIIAIILFVCSYSAYSAQNSDGAVGFGAIGGLCVIIAGIVWITSRM